MTEQLCEIPLYWAAPAAHRRCAACYQGEANSATTLVFPARPTRRWCVRRTPMRVSYASTQPPQRICLACSACSPARIAWPTISAPSARSAAENKIRHEVARARRQRSLLRPASAAAGRQGAPCRRSGRDGGRRNPGQALDAAEAVDVTYEDLPCVSASPKTPCSRAPRRSGTRCPTISWSTPFRRCRRDRAVLCEAAHVVAKDFHVGRVTGVPIEPRAAVANYDKADGRYTIYAGSGGAVRQKRELADRARNRPRTNSRTVVRRRRQFWHAQSRLCGIWPGAVGRPQARPSGKYTATRSECFVSDYQGRDLVAKFELALDERGRFLALRATNISNVGARCVSLSPLSKGAGLITGSYDIPVASLRAMSVFTNTMPTQAYRSSGRPEMTFAIERLIDIAGQQLGIDRVTLRRRNLVRPQAMPYRNAVGMLYDSGRYAENMDLAMRIADWDGFKARRRDAKKARQAARARPRQLRRVLDRRAEGASPHQRSRRSAASRSLSAPSRPDRATNQLCASGGGPDAVPVEKVRIILGDTDVVNAGGGTHSGRSMRHAATVFSLAARRVDRQRQACRRGHFRHAAGSRRISTTAAFPCATAIAASTFSSSPRK